jgi:hypothetical protein
MRLFFLAAALCVATGCFAQTAEAPRSEGWAPLFTVPGMTVLMDTARIDGSARAAEVWVAFDHTEPRPSPFPQGGQFTRWETRNALDCVRQSYVPREMRILGEGRVIASEKVQPAEKTFAEDVIGSTYRVICRLLEAREAGQLKEAITQVDAYMRSEVARAGGAPPR